LISAPYWSGLDLALETRSLARVVQVDIPLDEVFKTSSIQYYETALAASSIPIKAILVCNPHNPLGRCYSPEIIKGLLDFCQRNQLHYISDEVYRMSSFSSSDRDATPAFSSILSLSSSSELTPWIHTVYSMSKDFGCSGLRMVSFSFHGRSLNLNLTDFRV
jgi:aspartate/methionine/tyrosine aminotransferase